MIKADIQELTRLTFLKCRNSFFVLFLVHKVLSSISISTEKLRLPQKQRSIFSIALFQFWRAFFPPSLHSRIPFTVSDIL